MPQSGRGRREAGPGSSPAGARVEISGGGAVYFRELLGSPPERGAQSLAVLDLLECRADLRPRRVEGGHHVQARADGVAETGRRRRPG